MDNKDDMGLINSNNIMSSSSSSPTISDFNNNEMVILERVCGLRGYDLEKATIPSQRRYISHFSMILSQLFSSSSSDNSSSMILPSPTGRGLLFQDDDGDNDLCFLDRVVMNSIPQVYLRKTKKIVD